MRDTQAYEACQKIFSVTLTKPTIRDILNLDVLRHVHAPGRVSPSFPPGLGPTLPGDLDETPCSTVPRRHYHAGAP